MRIGSGTENVKLINASLIGDGKADSIGVYCSNSQASLMGISVEKYKKAARISGVDYTFVPNNIKGGTKVATSSGVPKI
ncbi:hypothetical protein P5614_000025 [Bacillus velezensis]|uniref:hypothetical protein n=1 Tax=Bacillus velezensis TaxID=492670 RepID=UPI003CE6E23E